MGLLREKKVLAGPQLRHMQVVQVYGNFCAHHQNEVGEVIFAHVDLKPVLGALECVLGWYFEQFLHEEFVDNVVELSGLLALRDLKLAGESSRDDVEMELDLDDDAVEVLERHHTSVPSIIWDAEALVARGRVIAGIRLLCVAADELEHENSPEQLERVIARLAFLAPDDVTILKRVARFYVDRHDAQRSLRYLQALYSHIPRDREVLRMIAQVFEEQGAVEKAEIVRQELATVSGPQK